MSNTSINETFIIGNSGESPDFSACTVFFSNEIKSCTGNTTINLGENIIVFGGNLLAPSVSATTFYGDGSNLTGISKQDVFVTGGTYSNGTAIFRNNSGGTFSVTGFSITTAFTGGTVSGATVFTGGLSANTITANTISAETYNGYVPYNSTNPNGYITAFTGGTVSGVTIFTNGLSANTISATTYENVAHNSTTGLQGGSPAGVGEYYHLTASQNTRVLNLIYSGQVTTFGVSPTVWERGTATTVTASYRMIAGDDIYTSAVINPLGFNLYPTFTDGVARTTAFTQSTSANTITYTLNYSFTRNGVSVVTAATATFTTFLPQWCGVNVAFSAATNYAAVSALGLTKIVSSSAVQTMTPTASNQYIWFISNKSTAIVTQTGFPTTVSLVNVEDGVSDFYLKTFTITLADGVTTGALFTYISRLPKTLSGIIYAIS